MLCLVTALLFSSLVACTLIPCMPVYYVPYHSSYYVHHDCSGQRCAHGAPNVERK